MDFLLEMQTGTRNAKFDLADRMAEPGSERLVGAELQHHFAVKAHIQQFTVLDCTFSNLNSADSTYDNCRWMHTRFTDSDFIYSHFSNCYFKNVRFENCSFRFSTFEGCVFDSCTFADSKPVGASDELSFHSCLFIDETGLRELFSEKATQFLGCILDGNAAIAGWEERGQNLLRKKPEVKKAPPRQLPVAQTETQKATPSSPSPTPKAEAVSSASRFDKLELG